MVIAVWTVILIILIFRIYYFNPLSNFSFKNKEINVVILPLFNVDAESYFTIDEYSTYFQNTTHRLLIKNAPTMPERIKVNIVSFPKEAIPLFLYKPDTIHSFFSKIHNYAFIVWGYRLKDNF